MTTTVHKLLIEAEADTKGVTKMQKELTALYKDQQKSTKVAAAEHLKAKTQNKETAKLTGPDALKKQNAAAKQLLETEKKLTAEAKKQAQIRKEINATNRLAQRTTFSGAFRKAMGFRQPGDTEAPNWRARLGAGVAGGLRAGIGMAGGGLTALMMAPIAAMSADYQAYTSYRRQMAQLSGMGRGTPFGGAQGITSEGTANLSRYGARLGFMPEESIDALHQMGRAVGTASAPRTTAMAMGASRLTGQTIQEISAFMAEQRRGAGAFGTQQRREFQQTLQTAVEAGMDASTLPEYMEGIQSILQNVNQRGGANSPSQIAALLALAQRSGIAGLAGQRGVQTLTGVDAGVRGAGDVNLGLRPFFNALALQEAGLGRGASYSGAAGRLQAGIFQSGGIGLTGVRHIVGSARSAGLSGSDLNQGLVDAGYAQTQRQAADVIRLLDQQGSDTELQQLLERTTQTELDVQHEIADNTERIADLLGAATPGRETGAVRQASIAMEDIARGEAMAPVLDSLQDIMREFITEMQEPLHILAEQLPPILQEVTTAVAGLTNFLTHPDEMFTGSQSTQDIAAARQLELSGSAIDARVAAGLPVTSEQIQQAITDLAKANQQIQDVYDNPSSRFYRQTLLGQASADQAEADANSEMIARLTAALEANTRAIETSSTATTTAPTDPAVGLLADGVRAAPPSPVRTTVSMSGTGR